MRKQFLRRSALLFLTVFLLTGVLLTGNVYADAVPHWAESFMRDADWGAYIPMEMRTEEGHILEYRIQHNIIRPDAALTGGQFAEMVVRAVFPNELNAAQGNTVTERVMAAARNAGLLEGTQVSASAAISRYDAAVIVTNALAEYQISGEALEAVQSLIGDFSRIPEQYRQAVSNLYALELVSGKGRGGRFCGSDQLTFAEGCVLVSRMDRLVSEHVGVFDLNYTIWQETADGRQFVTGKRSSEKPLPVEEAAVEDVPVSDYVRDTENWRRLVWPGLEVDCRREGNGEELVYRLRLTAPGYTTFHGISVGSTVEELIAAYQDFGEILKFDSETECCRYIPEYYLGSHAYAFSFDIENGVVTAITIGY